MVGTLPGADYSQNCFVENLTMVGCCHPQPQCGVNSRKVSRFIRAMLIMSPHVLCFDKHISLSVGSYHSTSPDAG